MRIFQVDAFTTAPFRGNPAAVCLITAPRDDGWMQAVAAEMNLSETAFVRASPNSPNSIGLRWFTPIVEADLCGHATLASAHVLWEQGDGRERLAFDTRSGRLVAERASDGIHLDFPAEPAAPVDSPAGLALALGAPPVWVGRNRLDYLVELADAAAVRSLRPDLGALRALPVRGVIVTARSDRDDCDFVSRFFSPGTGIDEDPVTGSAHCCLGPFWAARLGRDHLVGHQVSARGGVVGVRVAGLRVVLVGQAVTVMRGELAEGLSALA